MFEQPARDPGLPLNDRLAWLADQLSPDTSTVGPGGRLVRRWLPAGTGRRRLALVAVLAAVVLVVVGAVAVAGGRPAPEAPPPLPAAKAAGEVPAPAKAGLVVSVVGKVRSPGLVTVQQGARVADVLRAAGGADPTVDLSTLNLARKVTDGEQIAVGVPAPAIGGAGTPAAKVDLNSATAEQLDTLPGVGAVMARRIVQWRTEHGGFSRVEQLRDVPGIGESKFAKLREQVTIG